MAKRRKESSDVTDDEEKFIKGLARMMRRLGRGSPRANVLADFFEATQRIHFRLERELEALKKSDAGMYHRLAGLVHAHHQPFLDHVSDALAGSDMEQHLDARTQLAEPSSLLYGGLMTNGGFRLRATLIEWLADEPSTKNIVAMLEELQKLMPELEPGDDIE